MTKRFTKKFIDNSTNKGFKFIFFCDICCKPIESALIKYSLYKKPWLFRLGRFSNTEWNIEHDIALEFAISNAKSHFNKCQCCGNYVCDDDYNINSGMCCFCSPNIN